MQRQLQAKHQTLYSVINGGNTETLEFPDHDDFTLPDVIEFYGIVGSDLSAAECEKLGLLTSETVEVIEDCGVWEAELSITELFLAISYLDQETFEASAESRGIDPDDAYTAILDAAYPSVAIVKPV